MLVWNGVVYSALALWYMGITLGCLPGERGSSPRRVAIILLCCIFGDVREICADDSAVCYRLLLAQYFFGVKQGSYSNQLCSVHILVLV